PPPLPPPDRCRSGESMDVFGRTASATRGPGPARSCPGGRRRPSERLRRASRRQRSGRPARPLVYCERGSAPAPARAVPAGYGAAVHGNTVPAYFHLLVSIASSITLSPCLTLPVFQA